MQVKEFYTFINVIYISFEPKFLVWKFMVREIWGYNVQSMIMHVRVRIGKLWLHIAGGVDEFCEKNVWFVSFNIIYAYN
jgi:hypothetical protein